MTTAKQQTPTLLVIHPGRDSGDSVYTLLVAETGEPLASHLCSHAGFAPGDLYHNRKERKSEWAERFGEVEISFLEDTDISDEELIARNHRWAKEQEKLS